MNQRRKGSRIGPKLRAEIAADIAARVPKADVARTRRVSREAIRQMEVGNESEQFARWVDLARRRLSTGVPHERIVSELLETVEVVPAEIDPVAAWDAFLPTLKALAGSCHVWNLDHDEDLLETNVDHILILASEHVGLPGIGSHCMRSGAIVKAVLDARLSVATLDRQGLAEARRAGKFVPFNDGVVI